MRWALALKDVLAAIITICVVVAIACIVTLATWTPYAGDPNDSKPRAVCTSKCFCDAGTEGAL